MSAYEEKLYDILKQNDERHNQNKSAFREWFLTEFNTSTDNSCTLESFALWLMNLVHERTYCYTLSERKWPPLTDEIRHHTKDTINASSLSNISSMDMPGSNDYELNNTSTPNRMTPKHRNTSQNLINSNTCSAKHIKHNSSAGLCFGDFLDFDAPSSKARGSKKKPQQQLNLSSQKSNEMSKNLQFADLKTTKQRNIYTSTSKGTVSPESQTVENKSCAGKNGKSKPIGDAESATQRKFKKENSRKTPSPKLDVTVVHNAKLRTLADIYSLLIDFNFVTSVLSEISYLVNLLNVAYQPPWPPSFDLVNSATKTFNIQNIFNDVINCVYFASFVISKQRIFLSSLDVQSLGFILSLERIAMLTPDLIEYLKKVYEDKKCTESKRCLTAEESYMSDSNCLSTVHYQNEKTLMDKFLSLNDTHSLKTQRDIFYKSLKYWNEHHKDLNFIFSREMTTYINNIFKTSINPTNMYHFAKLFVFQLMLSSRNSLPPMEFGCDASCDKINKLIQRMEEPSNFIFSENFPGEQKFFHDFILESPYVTFLEQLKYVLFHELTLLNNSSFEQINLIPGEENEYPIESIEKKHFEYIVRPETLASMQIIAKFLGFTMDLASNGRWLMPENVMRKQFTMRQLFTPGIDLNSFLQDAIKNRKILITLPWLVEYLAMLSDLTLKLSSYKAILEGLFDLYIRIGFNDIVVVQDSRFMIRCCIGWLFETKPIIAQKYYQYRNMHGGDHEEDITDMKRISCFISKNIDVKLSSLDTSLIIVNMEPLKGGTYTCILTEQRSNKFPIMKQSGQLESVVTNNATLNEILKVVCPFLVNFRSSVTSPQNAIMNQNSAGRRRIEFRTSNCDSIINLDDHKKSSNEKLLIEAFLHSQNLSMRRLIEFITERIYKCVVKDLQNQILFPIKTHTDQQINDIKIIDYESILFEVGHIYKKAIEEALHEWDAQDTINIDSRIQAALNALLPAGTNKTIESTYFYIIKRDATQKIQQWRNENIAQSNPFCNDQIEIAVRIFKSNQKHPLSIASTDLIIINLVPSVSEMFEELHNALFFSANRHDLFQSPESIIQLLKKMEAVFNNTLPLEQYRIIAISLIRLAQQIICLDPKQLITELINGICHIYLTDIMKEVVTNFSKSKSASECIFCRLVSVHFIIGMANRQECYDKYKELLNALIKQKVVTIDYLNTLFVSVYKHEWDAETLQNISQLLNSVAFDNRDTEGRKGNSSGAVCYDKSDDEDSDGKSAMFMEVLADFARDVDF